MRGYSLSKSAENDLIEIWEYSFATWGRRQADKYFDGLLTCLDRVGQGNARCRVVEGIPSEVRVSLCQQHYIFFTDDNEPAIVAILHGSMNFLARLKSRLS